MKMTRSDLVGEAVGGARFPFFFLFCFFLSRCKGANGLTETKQKKARSRKQFSNLSFCPEIYSNTKKEHFFFHQIGEADSQDEKDVVARIFPRRGDGEKCLHTRIILEANLAELGMIKVFWI